MAKGSFRTAVETMVERLEDTFRSDPVVTLEIIQHHALEVACLCYSAVTCVASTLKHSLERRMLLVSRNTAAAASCHHLVSRDQIAGSTDPGGFELVLPLMFLS